LSLISAQTLRVCRERKPVPTFPDHALILFDLPSSSVAQRALAIFDSAGFYRQQMTLPVAMGACAIAFYIVGIIAALLLRDKMGVDLRMPDRERGSSASRTVDKANLQAAAR
jgi:hypothetical protein